MRISDWSSDVCSSELGDRAGIAVHDLDVLDRHAERRGDELREGGLVALAVAVGAGEDGDRAGRIEAHLRRLPEADAGAERADHRRGGDAAGLDVGGEADAAQLALGLGLLPARRETRSEEHTSELQSLMRISY